MDYKEAVSAAPRKRRSARPAPASAEEDDARTPSLREVYTDYSGYVWRIALRMGIPEHAVEDVMHEVFLIVDRRLPQFDGQVAMTTWLYHQTRGVVSNHRRRHHREQRRIAIADPKPSPSIDPEAEVGRKQAAAFVDDFIGGLDPQKREVFALVELEGLPVPEVAQMIGINLNTAYSRLRAARTQFSRAAERISPQARPTQRRSQTA